MLINICGGTVFRMSRPIRRACELSNYSLALCELQDPQIVLLLLGLTFWPNSSKFALNFVLNNRVVCSPVKKYGFDWILEDILVETGRVGMYGEVLTACLLPCSPSLFSFFMAPLLSVKDRVLKAVYSVQSNVSLSVYFACVFHPSSTMVSQYFFCSECI